MEFRGEQLQEDLMMLTREIVSEKTDGESRDKGCPMKNHYHQCFECDISSKATEYIRYFKKRNFKNVFSAYQFSHCGIYILYTFEHPKFLE